MMLWIVMKRYGLSIRGMIAELHFRCGSLKMARLERAPSESWFPRWMHRLPMEMLNDLILFIAGDEAYGSFSVDSPTTGSTGTHWWTTPRLEKTLSFKAAVADNRWFRPEIEGMMPHLGKRDFAPPPIGAIPGLLTERRPGLWLRALNATST